MHHRTVIAADIAKTNFQCIQFRNHQAVSKSKNYKRPAFENLITADKPMTLVMESCSGAHHWARLAEQHGHEVILIPPKTVTGFRQGHKTDTNDAYAIYDASRSVNLKLSVRKSLETQALQVLGSVRDGYQNRKKQLSNALRGHLAEFGIVMPKGYASLKRRLPGLLEDPDNGLPDAVRFALNEYWLDWQRTNVLEAKIADRIKAELKGIAAAKEVMKLEGIGPVNAVGLLCALGDGRGFNKGKEAAAYIGLTPKQHSTGGKEVYIGIGKQCGHKRLRSSLIQGARAMIIAVKTRGPVSETEHWLLALVERCGENRAAVALANKNVRRAWALISHQRSCVLS